MNRITVNGTPSARGRQYGWLAAPQVHRCISAYRDIFQHRAGLDWNAAVAHARTFVGEIEGFAPDAIEEMRGIADGAEVPFDAILVLNCRSELMFAAARSKGQTGECPSFAVPPGECTSFAVTPEASSDGHMLLGQNWDWVPFAREVCVLLDVQRERGDKPSFATIVEAGMLAK